MKNLFFIAVLLFSSNVLAAQSALGVIKELNANVNGGVQVIFNVADVTGTAPSCAINDPGVFFFDGTTVAGQNMYKLLASAKIAGLKARVLGVGRCDFFSYEGINYVGHQY